MSDYAVTINLPDHKLHDIWPLGLFTIGPVLIDEAQPTDQLTRIRMGFKQGSRRFTLDSEAGGDGLITIDDAATWEAHIDQLQEFLPKAGAWEWDMEFYSGTNTAPQTWYKGTLTVHQDVTPQPTA